MKPNVRHNLTYRASKAAKNASRGQFDEIDKVESQLSFEVAATQLYLLKEFSLKPHGSALRKDIDCTLMKELVNLIAERECDLMIRHCDVMDDVMAGYNLGASYSFQQEDKLGRLCRVTIVMTSHKRVGEWMDKYNKGDYNNDDKSKCDGFDKNGNHCAA